MNNIPLQQRGHAATWQLHLRLPGHSRPVSDRCTNAHAPVCRTTNLLMLAESENVITYA